MKHTKQSKKKKFATFLFDENLQLKKDVYDRYGKSFRQESEEVVSMNDPGVYGNTFYEMSFKEAVDREIICDYRIITLIVSGEAKALMEDHASVMTELEIKKLKRMPIILELSCCQQSL